MWSVYKLEAAAVERLFPSLTQDVGFRLGLGHATVLRSMVRQRMSAAVEGDDELRKGRGSSVGVSLKDEEEDHVEPAELEALKLDPGPPRRTRLVPKRCE